MNSNQNELMTTVTYLTSRLSWFRETQQNYRDRSDALEAMHKIDLKKMDPYWLPELARACFKAINSYEKCSGYAKHWKYFRKKIIDQIDKSVEIEDKIIEIPAPMSMEV